MSESPFPSSSRIASKFHTELSEPTAKQTHAARNVTAKVGGLEIEEGGMRK
jgi:hypothetical protein